jgi:hypothetical protein
MRAVFLSITLSLAVAVFVVVASIIRDVMPRLAQEEQEYFRNWFNSWGTMRFDRALRNAWDLHVQFFPRSRKRTLLACVLTAALLSVVADPIWRALN